MSEQPEIKASTEASKSAVETVVSLQCKCGKEFERPEQYLINAKDYADEYPSAARFNEMKIRMCEGCYKERVTSSLKRLPEILKALAS